MAFFKKNPNESAYAGGEKHLTEIIKNTGPADAIIWRQPEEDFNTNSTLIVMPGEAAVFVNKGLIQQVFKSGTYKLSTSNYPFIGRLLSAFSGGVSAFNCVIYYVRTTDTKEIRWGTDTPIQVRDKVWGVRTDARVRGIYKLCIEYPELFLEKMIGNKVQMSTQAEIDQYFVSEMQGKVKSAVSKFLNELDRELIGIDAYMNELSSQIEPYINETVAEYGLKCVTFTLVGIDIDKTKYDAIDESQIDLIAKQRGYQADKAGLDILGADWDRVQNVEIMKEMAKHPVKPAVVPPCGAAAAAAYNNMMPQTQLSQMNNTCNQQQASAAQDDPMVVLEKLKKMLDAGLISQEKYDAKVEEVLARI